MIHPQVKRYIYGNKVIIMMICTETLLTWHCPFGTSIVIICRRFAGNCVNTFSFNRRIITNYIIHTYIHTHIHPYIHTYMMTMTCMHADMVCMAWHGKVWWVVHDWVIHVTRQDYSPIHTNKIIVMCDVHVCVWMVWMGMLATVSVPLSNPIQMRAVLQHNSVYQTGGSLQIMMVLAL